MKQSQCNFENFMMKSLPSRWNNHHTLSCNSNIHYRVQKSPPPDPYPCQLNSIHILTAHFSATHFKIIIWLMPMSPTWSQPLRLSSKYFLIISCLYQEHPWWVGPLSPRHGTSSGCGWREVLQLRRGAANMLNNQSHTADKGWLSSLGVERMANPSP